MSETSAGFVKQRAPTLYVIIAIKLAKGLLLVLLAAGVYRLSDENLPEAFHDLLLFFHFDPEKKFFTDLAERVSAFTPSGLMWLAWGTVLYSLFSLVEGVGLIFRVPWAGWLAIGESAFFVPIEIFEVLRKPSRAVLVVLVLNIFIVWYLFQNRHRLFRHHHH
jgi:uncharacterized membrane protein (DUF2068 family)